MFHHATLILILSSCWLVNGFIRTISVSTTRREYAHNHKHRISTPTFVQNMQSSYTESESVWDEIAINILGLKDQPSPTDTQLQRYVSTISALRVGIPALALALSAKTAYPIVAMSIASAIDDSGVFAVVAQDASQYIQNILTTSGLVFSLLVGQTYYFMVRKQDTLPMISKIT